MKRHLTIVAIVMGFIILGFAIITGKGQVSAGDLLDKQIKIENQIKKLQAELKEVTDQKSQLYVEGINKDVFTQERGVAPASKSSLEKPSQALTLTR